MLFVVLWTNSAHILTETEPSWPQKLHLNVVESSIFFFFFLATFVAFFRRPISSSQRLLYKNEVQECRGRSERYEDTRHEKSQNIARPLQKSR